MKVIVILSCFVLFVTCMSIRRPDEPITELDAKDLPIGAVVTDYNGLVIRKEGNLACWTTEHLSRPKPYLSKPIYKYCRYSLPSWTSKPVCVGHLLEGGEMDDYPNSVFAANPSQTVAFIVDVNLTENILSTYLIYFQKQRFNSSESSSRYFLCNTSGCNIPVDIMSFLEFNSKQKPAPVFEFDPNPTVSKKLMILVWCAFHLIFQCTPTSNTLPTSNCSHATSIM